MEGITIIIIVIFTDHTVCQHLQLLHYISSSQQPSGVGTVVNPIEQRRKLISQHRAAK